MTWEQMDVSIGKMLLIKEQVGMLKLKDTFDIFDPATGEKVGIAEKSACW